MADTFDPTTYAQDVPVAPDKPTAPSGAFDPSTYASASPEHDPATYGSHHPEAASHLASDPSVDPADLVGDLETQPLAIQIFKERANKPASFKGALEGTKEFGKGFVEGVPGAVKSIAGGTYDWMRNLGEMGVGAARAGGDINNPQTQRAGTENAAAIDMIGLNLAGQVHGLSKNASRLANILTGGVMGKRDKDLTDEEILDRLWTEKAYKDTIKSTAEGHSFLTDAGIAESPEDLANQGYPVRSEGIEGMAAAANPENMLPVHAVMKPGLVAKGAGYALKGSGAAIEGIGEQLAKTGKHQSNLLVAAYEALHGDPKIAMAAYIAPYIAKGAIKAGNFIKTAGDELLMKPEERAMFAEFNALSDAERQGIIDHAKGFLESQGRKGLQAAATGSLAMAPFAASDQTPEEAGRTFGAGAGLGMMGSAGHDAALYGRQKAFDSYFKTVPNNGNPTVNLSTKSYDYGTDPQMDADHNAMMASASPEEKDTINQLRHLMQGKYEVYQLPFDKFNNVVQQINPDADAQGVTIANYNGKPTILIREGAIPQTKWHEVLHGVYGGLSPEAQAAVDRASFSRNDPDAFASSYQTQLTGKPADIKYADLTPDQQKQVRDEMAAETLGNLSIAQITQKPSLVRQIQGALGRTAESLGIPTTTREISSITGVQPTFKAAYTMEQALRNQAANVGPENYGNPPNPPNSGSSAPQAPPSTSKPQSATTTPPAQQNAPTGPTGAQSPPIVAPPAGIPNLTPDIVAGLKKKGFTDEQIASLDPNSVSVKGPGIPEVSKDTGGGFTKSDIPAVTVPSKFPEVASQEAVQSPNDPSQASSIPEVTATAVSEPPSSIPSVAGEQPEVSANPFYKIKGHQYTPAVKSESGKIFTGADHEEALRKLEKSGEKEETKNARGFLSKEGEFLNLMEVANREAGNAAASSAPAPVPAVAGDSAELPVRGGGVVPDISSKVAPDQSGRGPSTNITPEIIQGKLQEANASVADKMARAKSPEKRQEIARKARLGALKSLLGESDTGLHPVTDEATGEVSYKGHVDPANPVHKAILDQFGYTPEQIQTILDLQKAQGQSVYLRDYNSAAQEGFAEGGAEFTGAKRGEEYKASPTGKAGERKGEISKQDKPFTPLGTVLTDKGINVFGFDHDKFLSNVRAILDAAHEGGEGETITRFTHKDGKGLLDRSAWDLSKLTDDEEAELPELLDYGMEQPRGAKGKFYFTDEGLAKHKELIRLIKKASKSGGLKKEVTTLSNEPNWRSSDGQLAVDENDPKIERQSIKTGYEGLKGSKLDDEIAADFRAVSANHAAGYDNKGKHSMEVFPDVSKPRSDAPPQPVDPNRANVINMAMANEGAKPPGEARGKTDLAQAKFAKALDKSKQALGIADLNAGFRTPEGEVNPLRDQLNKNGFDSKATLKPAFSNVRPDLIEGGVHPTPGEGKSVHAHGFDIPAAELAHEGFPKNEFVSAGFLPAGDKPNRDFLDRAISIRGGKSVPIHDPSESVSRALAAHSEHPAGATIETLPISSIDGGTSDYDPTDAKRVKELSKQISSDDGYISRIIVDHNNNVLEGQHRFDALKSLGATEIPVVKVHGAEDYIPDIDRVREAMKGSGLHRDQVGQIISNLGKILMDEKGNAQELNNYDHPRGYEKVHEAAVAEIQRQLGGKLPASAEPIKTDNGEVATKPSTLFLPATDPANPKNLTAAALRLNNGDLVYAKDLNTPHMILMTQGDRKYGREAFDRLLRGSVSGWVDARGNFLDRAQSKKRAIETGQASEDALDAEDKKHFGVKMPDLESLSFAKARHNIGIPDLRK